MAKNIENSKHRPIKSCWKSLKSESVEHTKKHLRFNLQPDLLDSEVDKPTYTVKDDDDGDEEEQTPVETPTKKRKKETKIELPEDVDELEEEIERLMSSKAEKSNLTVMNVRNILRSVITNKYVVDMVRQTVEEGRVTEVPFEPKLTRAKTKELLKQNPAVGFLTPVKASMPDINPEIKLLIDKELSEDSSDEEYNPENEEEQEQSDDDDKGDTSIVSDLDSLPPTPASLPAPLTPLQDCSLDEDSTFKVPQENVGQRTRSKLDLNELPLESLEQAFVPPDITQDMYEQECDNPDWHQFLKEFTQPLAMNETLEDDVDNDPEYNILEDIEGQPVEDKEEMRKDRAVKVTKRELKALMTELFECTDIPTSDDDDVQTTESIAALEESIIKETEERERREVERRGIHPIQRELLGQQLRQHVQLTTQHFLQTYRHPIYHYHAAVCKTMLVTLDGLKKDKVCGQTMHNMAAAIDTVVRWEHIHSHPADSHRITGFIKEQMKKEKIQKNKKKNPNMEFPPELIRLVMDSEAFLYPMLLPPLPFRVYARVTGHSSFCPAEDMLLAICLEQVKETQPQLYDRMMTDVTALIYRASMPRSTPSCMAAHIRRCKSAKQINPIKSFFETGESPKVLHFVIPVQIGVKLAQQPSQLLPEIWRDYLVSTSKVVFSSTNSLNSKVKSKTSRKSKKTHSNNVPDMLKGCLSFQNGKWHSLIDHKKTYGTSNFKPTIVCTKLINDGHDEIHTNTLENLSLTEKKHRTLEEPSRSSSVVSFAKPVVPEKLNNSYTLKSNKINCSKIKHCTHNRQFPKKSKKKQVVVDKSTPPKIKFVIKPGLKHHLETKAEDKLETLVQEKNFTLIEQRSLQNEVEKTELKEQSDYKENGLFEMSVKKTEEFSQKRNKINAKSKILNCNGKVTEESKRVSTSEEESRTFLLNLDLVSKNLVVDAIDCRNKCDVETIELNRCDSSDKISSRIIKQCVSDSRRTQKNMNGMIQSVSENLIKQVPPQLVSRTRSKEPSHQVPHHRRPPSTVKLKKTLGDLTCKFNLNKPKTKVPTSLRRPKN